MKKAPLTIGASVALVASLLVCGPVRADDTAKVPTTGSTKAHPGNGPAAEKSLSSSAPRATSTQTTGANDQNRTVKAMNSNEKAKLDAEGK